MSYTIVDLLEKLETIEINAGNTYRSISEMEENIKLRTVAKVLATEEDKHVALYKKLIKQAVKQPEIEIDFNVYDKASSLVEEFRKRINKPKVQSVRELVKFALEFEQENVALLIDIRGRMVKKEDESVNFNYLTLTELIMEEQKHVRDLKMFL